MTNQAHPHTVLPTFSPVPREKARHNGWNAQVQLTFILRQAQDYRRNASPAHPEPVEGPPRRPGRGRCLPAAPPPRGGRVPRRLGRRARYRHAAHRSCRAIRFARQIGTFGDRALNGVEVPVYSYGKLVGSRTVYNDRLVMFMLRNRAPERFTGGRAKAMNAADKETVRKLKLEWRAEWERERAILANQQSRARDTSMVDKIKAMHRDWFTAMSPKARAAYRAFRAIEDADDGSWTDAFYDDGDESDSAGAGEDNRGRDRMALAIAQAEAEYEEWFAAAADPRAHVAKLVDMRAWRQEGEEAGEDGGEETGQESGEDGGEDGGDDTADWGPTWDDVGEADPDR